MWDDNLEFVLFVFTFISIVNGAGFGNLLYFWR